MNKAEIFLLNLMDGVRDNLFIFAIIAIVTLTISLIYILYVERKSRAWLGRREQDAKMIFSLKSIPWLNAIQTRIANKLAIANTASRQENEQYDFGKNKFHVGTGVGKSVRTG